MDELINQLLSTNMCGDSNGEAIMDDINKLLDVNLRRDTTWRIIRGVFIRNPYEGHSRPDRVPEVPADCKDRMSFMSDFFEWIPVKEETLQKFTKNREVSTALRSKANDLFNGKRNMQRAMQLYNLAIMFGEPGGEELGLAFANRSAVLLEQKDPEGALKDIDLAMKHNYPERLVSKLEKRREKCVKMLEEFEESYLTQEIKTGMASMRKYKEELLKLKNPNPLIPCAENFVEIGHTDEVGRQLVVNQDVPVGAVVIVERPFTSVNEGLLKFEASHCDHCYKFLKNGIPCQHCVFVMYCSEECRSNASSGHHKFECASLSSLYLLSSLDRFSQMAFRVVCKVGPEEFYRLFVTKDPNFFDIKKPFGTEPNCKYESDSYLSIHHLVGHSDMLDIKTRSVNGLNGLQLTSILEARTDFFKVSPEDKIKKFKIFVAASLLRLAETLAYNGVAIEEMKSLQGRTQADIYRLKEVKGSIKEVLEYSRFDLCVDKTSGGLYSVGSLMNHSCDPSALRVFNVSNGTMVVVTTRALKKGEPLTTSGGPRYETSSNLMERRVTLMRRFFFECHCVACKNDWPNLKILKTNFRPEDVEFTCPNCSLKFSHEEKCFDEFIKCCLTGSRPTCGLCGKSYKREELIAGLRSALTMQSRASTDIEYNRPVGVVEAYKEFVTYVQFNTRPPYALLLGDSWSFIQALTMILHWEE